MVVFVVVGIAVSVGLTRANVVSEPGETRKYFEKPGELQEAGEDTRTPDKEQNTRELGSLFRLI